MHAISNSKQKRHFWSFSFPQRLAAAFLAIADRCSYVSFSERAAAPASPERTLPDGIFRFSLISPVAILAIMTARTFTSAGRFSPLGPVGILFRNHFVAHDEHILVFRTALYHLPARLVGMPMNRPPQCGAVGFLIQPCRVSYLVRCYHPLAHRSLRTILPLSIARDVGKRRGSVKALKFQTETLPSLLLSEWQLRTSPDHGAQSPFRDSLRVDPSPAASGSRGSKRLEAIRRYSPRGRNDGR